MNLVEALDAIAAQIGLDSRLRQALQDCSLEDDLGGWNFNFAEERFPSGSIWGVEGQVLYALVCTLRSYRVVEIGGWHGCSASHLALAVKCNGQGRVFSIDDGSEINHVGRHGDMIPDDLRPFVQLIQDDGATWLAKQPDGSLDLLFEDDNHTTAMVEKVSRLAVDKLRKGGILVNHDTADHPTGENVRRGLDNAGIPYRAYLIEPSDCGISIWRKGWT